MTPAHGIALVASLEKPRRLTVDDTRLLLLAFATPAGGECGCGFPLSQIALGAGQGGYVFCGGCGLVYERRGRVQ